MRFGFYLVFDKCTFISFFLVPSLKFTETHFDAKADILVLSYRAGPESKVPCEDQNDSRDKS